MWLTEGGYSFNSTCTKLLLLHVTLTELFHELFVSLFIQENGFEFDLAPFTCRHVEISFAVATNWMAVSDYSPPATLFLSSGSKYRITYHPTQSFGFPFVESHVFTHVCKFSKMWLYATYMPTP